MGKKAIHLAEDQYTEKAVCGRGLFGMQYTYSQKHSTCKACARVYKQKKRRALRNFLTYILFYA